MKNPISRIPEAAIDAIVQRGKTHTMPLDGEFFPAVGMLVVVQFGMHTREPLSFTVSGPMDEQEASRRAQAAMRQAAGVYSRMVKPPEQASCH